MTFSEWVKRISKETDSKIPYALVRDIMVAGIRLIVEEFLINPAEVDFEILGIGRFYLNHRICHNNFPVDEDSEYKTYWTIQFKPSKILKDVLNGKKDPHGMLIGYKTPLYPDFIYDENGKAKRGQDKGKLGNYKVQYEVKVIQSYRTLYRKAMKEALKNNLPKGKNE